VKSNYPKITAVDFGSTGNTLTINVRKMAAVYIQGKSTKNKLKASEPLVVPLSASPRINITSIQKVGQPSKTSYYDETDYSLSQGLSEPSSPYFVTVEDIPSKQQNADLTKAKSSYLAYDLPSARGLVGWLTSIIEKRPFLGLDVAAENLSYSLLKLLRDINHCESGLSIQGIISSRSDAVGNDLNREKSDLWLDPVTTSEGDLDYLLRQAEQFDMLKQDLLKDYDGYFVLFHDGKVLDSDLDEKKLLLSAYKKYGSKPFFIEFVGSASKEEHREDPTIHTIFG